jgi:tRNA(Arg) A34 adenosine deaminase TadA
MRGVLLPLEVYPVHAWPMRLAPRPPISRQSDLYVTLEPWAICAAGTDFARPRPLYFGAYDPKGSSTTIGRHRGAAYGTARHRGQPADSLIRDDDVRHSKRMLLWRTRRGCRR